MGPDQEANSGNFRDFFILFCYIILLDEAILMSTHNIQFHDKILKYPYIFVFTSYRKNFVGTKNEFKSAVVKKPSVFELLRFNCTRCF